MLYAAAIVVFALVTVHSVAGELMILRHLDPSKFPRFLRSDVAAKQIVHATWHLPSVLGVAYVVILWRYAERGARDPFLIRTLAASMLACGVVVFVATRARHPGWLAFLVAAMLTWLGATA
jgi:hypothetical protein